MSTGRVLILAKPPRDGTAKTRLARGVGRQWADEMAQAMLVDTWLSLTRLTWARCVVATTRPSAPLGLQPEPEVWDQGGGGLGDRLERVLRMCLVDAPWAIVIGADSPGFPPEALALAASSLDGGAPAVLGPAEDGGFWLLGLSRCPEGLLAGLPWSSEHTAEATRLRLESRGMQVTQATPWFDLDDIRDLRRFGADVPRARAPATHAVLAEWGRAVGTTTADGR